MLRFVAAEGDAMPATERRRVPSDIDGDVEYESTNYRDELPLGLPLLEMQASQHSLG